MTQPMARRGGRERISDRGHKREREISELHLGEFKPQGSTGLRFLQSLTPDHTLTRESLVILAQVFSSVSSIPFPRDFTRRRDLIIKWFTDHLDILEPFGCLLKLEVEPLQTRTENDSEGSNE
jgi:hypothetical protein